MSESALGIKSVVFTLQTKQSLKDLIETYNVYLKKQGYDSLVDSSTEDTIDISASNSKESAVIEGKIIDTKAGITEYTISWSEV